ncbi:MAG: 50S ribosomal protein L35 [Candidatus Omnitrophica bacterium CG11_big_fil_rev_8_21_14_0_20_41_12]|nr:MAG: 50S ribosomal protein L35 [Candidatus Omnitrophica bacterium CG11_big_fil_rev_8_21_14_0_20_41_12]
MPKLKTKRGVAKRFKISKRGKVKYSPGGKSHLASSKTTKKMRNLKKRRGLAGKKEVRFIKSMLPYG